MASCLLTLYATLGPRMLALFMQLSALGAGGLVTQLSDSEAPWTAAHQAPLSM